MAGEIKPFTITRSPVPREYVQRRPVCLLKRDDPDVWFGLDNGVVMTGTVIQGGDFHEEAFTRPVALRDQQRVQSQGRNFARTMDLQLRHHGALARTAKDGPGQPLTMKAFYHPVSGNYVVAGWDPDRRVWIVEG